MTNKLAQYVNKLTESNIAVFSLFIAVATLVGAAVIGLIRAILWTGYIIGLPM